MDITKLKQLLYKAGAELTYEREEVVGYDYALVNGYQYSRPSEFRQKYSVKLDQDSLEEFCNLLNTTSKS